MFADLRPADVIAAADRIRPFITRTALIRSAPLSAIAGADVYLKLENQQTTGSFKLRGALNVLATLTPEQRKRGVVASSAGNHGLGVAYAAKHFGTAATIFVPTNAPQVKRDGIAALGATLDTTQPHYDAAMDAAKAFAREHGATFINPCLGEMLLAGQGTVALEILGELPDLATLVLNVGGGGLLGGCASLVRAVSPSVRIVGAQSENTAAMAKSLAAGRLIEIDNLPTLADGLAGQIDDEAFDIGRHGLDDMATVSEAEIGDTIAWLWRTHEQRVEGAGACAAAAVRGGYVKAIEGPAVVVISGGNIDAGRHEKLLKAGV
ncbi:MAG TPA: threonine/serine dehydratase [Gemmatimonadaceae bacterium]|nr:threonine/serine dehydratase [Gemmatimonadaceae bacterium]